MNTPYKQFLLALSLFVLPLFASGNCFADWSGGIEAGASSNDKPTVRFYANKQSDPLSHYTYFDYGGSDNLRIGYNPTFQISHSVYSFGRFSLEEDDSILDKEFDALVGIGNNLFQRGGTQVKVETGLGARLQKFNDSDAGPIDDAKDGFVFLAGNVISNLLLARFDASLNAKAGSSQTTMDGEAGISIAIGPATRLRYVYSVKRYKFDDGQPDFDDEDTSFKITYGF